jgi:ribonuclease P protein component
MPKAHRVSRANFKTLQKGSSFRVSGEGITLSVYPMKNEWKCACVIPKKAIQLATKRNLVRRKVYAAVREFQVLHPLPAFMLFQVRSGDSDVKARVLNVLKKVAQRL